MSDPTTKKKTMALLRTGARRKPTPPDTVELSLGPAEDADDMQAPFDLGKALQEANDRVEQREPATTAGPKKAIIPRPNSNKSIHPLRDFWNNTQSAKDVTSGTFLGICYVDANGVETVRRLRVVDAGPFYLIAYCFEREAPRQFCVERIKYVFDLDGEITEDVGGYFAEAFGVYVPEENLRKFPKAKPHRQVIALCKDEISILAAIARADEELHPTEVEAILEYCRSVAEGHGITMDEDSERLLANHIRRQIPSPEQIEDLIATYFDDTDTSDPIRDTLMDAIEAVMQADGIIHENEIALRNRAARSRRTPIDLPFAATTTGHATTYGPIKGWKWCVPYGLRNALDIQFTPASKTKSGLTPAYWSVGSPPQYAFAVGTSLTHSNGLFALTITEATPDTALTEGCIKYQAFTRRQESDPWIQAELADIRQRDLAEGLQHGGLVMGDDA